MFAALWPAVVLAILEALVAEPVTGIDGFPAGLDVVLNGRELGAQHVLRIHNFTHTYAGMFTHNDPTSAHGGSVCVTAPPQSQFW